MPEPGGNTASRDPSGKDSAHPAPRRWELEDEEVPIPESPHIQRLRNSKGGPYYLAPDSTEPLPPRMWAGLDPDLVIAEAAKDNEELERLAVQDDPRTELPATVRLYLEAGGPASRRLLASLSRGLGEEPDELPIEIPASQGAATPDAQHP